jgi:NAD(P)-dependent dehydrogenase (short-subunit alcohol dehydrogenase family)
MKNTKSNKSVLVTGAGGGIGRATAIAFANSGAKVACLDIDQKSLDETVDLLNGAGYSIVADLCNIKSFPSILDEAESKIGPLDALAHVAAVLRRLKVTEVTEDDWDFHFDLNAKACFFLAREFAERLKAGQRSGAVVTTSSQSWWTGGLDGSIVYAATKGALVTMTRGFARQYAPSDIRFNSVAPGFVDTKMLRNGLDEAAMDRYREATPLGRLAEPEEVANAIVFLASPSSSYITGTTLVVAGGQLMF